MAGLTLTATPPSTFRAQPVRRQQHVVGVLGHRRRRLARVLQRRHRLLRRVPDDRRAPRAVRCHADRNRRIRRAMAVCACSRKRPCRRIDLRGRWLVPIHNGTFDLAMHRWQEPFERVTALAIVRGVDLSTRDGASHSTNRIAASVVAHGRRARDVRCRENRAAGRFARRPRSKTHRSLSIFPGARQCATPAHVAGVPAASTGCL